MDTRNTTDAFSKERENEKEGGGVRELQSHRNKLSIKQRRLIHQPIDMDCCVNKFVDATSMDSYTPTGRKGYRDPTSITPQPFNPLDVPKDASMIVYGRRRTGKSTWSRWYFGTRREDFPWVIVFTGTKQTGFWQSFVPDHFVREDWQPQVAAKIVARQMKKLGIDPNSSANPLKGGGQKTSKKKTFNVKDDAKEKDPTAFVMVWLDDVIHDNKIREDIFLKKFFVAGRHLALTVGVCTQRVTGVSPIMRTNADVAVVFRQTDASSKQRIIEDYLSDLNPRTAAELIDMYTIDKHALVIRTDIDSNDPSDYLFVTRAPPEIPRFMMGSKEQQQANDKEKQAKEQQRRSLVSPFVNRE